LLYKKAWKFEKRLQQLSQSFRPRAFLCGEDMAITVYEKWKGSLMFYL